MAKQVILDKATELLREPVDDAVMIFRRKPLFWLGVAVPVSIVTIMMLAVNLRGTAAIAIAGGLIGSTQVFLNDYYFVARTSSRVALLASKKWIGRPTAVLREVVPSDVVELTSGWTTTKFQFGEQTCHVSKIYLTRLRAILGR